MIDRLMVCRFILFFAFALPIILPAQETATPPPAATISAQNPASFDPAAATQAWLDTVPPDQRAKSDAYFEGGYWLILWNFLITALIALLLLVTRASARIRDFAERTTRFRPLQVIIYGILFLLLIYVLGFPLNVYERFFREHAYGMHTFFVGTAPAVGRSIREAASAAFGSGGGCGIELQSTLLGG